MPRKQHMETQHPVSDLTPYRSNPRQGNVDLIAESLEHLGQYRPIVVNRGTHTGRPNEVLAGNHTLQAAVQLGWDSIDVHWVDVDDDTAARIVLVDNRSNDLAGYDNQVLAELLQELPNLAATGYNSDDLDALLAENLPPVPPDPDETPPLPVEPISRPGDLWVLGKHRVLCGDATSMDDLARLVLEPADCLWTDPPYGVDYVGKTKDALTIQNDGASGLPALLYDAFTAAVTVLRPGAPCYVAHADTERITFETAMRDAGLVVRQNLVWVKNTIVMGRSDYHYQHEPILYGFTSGGEGRLGRGGKRWYGDNAQTTVIRANKPPANREHPTMKPVALIQAMLDNSCRPGGTVLDLFGGSGSTLIAAHITGRAARISELDPRYVDVICRRYQEVTGDKPVLEATGQPEDFCARA